MKKKKNIGVMIMTYGSPVDLDDILPYLKRIYSGKEPDENVIQEFKRRYSLIGMSPLVNITKKQASDLEKLLNQSPHKMQNHFLARAAMQFSQPFISEVVSELGRNVDMIIGIILSPQYSPIIMKGYCESLMEEASRFTNVQLRIAQDWHLNPYLIQAFSQSVTQTLETIPVKDRKSVPILFSAHSMPKRVIDKEPTYISHLKETADAVAKNLGLSKNQYFFCYQSAGHTPEEWLKPDFDDLLPELSEKGFKYVLIAPVQFLADHLETLYDIDIAAREQAQSRGMVFLRAASLNTSPLFIKALASVVFDILSEKQ